MIFAIVNCDFWHEGRRFPRLALKLHPRRYVCGHRGPYGDLITDHHRGSSFINRNQAIQGRIVKKGECMRLGLLSFCIFVSSNAWAQSDLGYQACSNFKNSSAIGGYGDQMQASLNAAIPPRILSTALKEIESGNKKFYTDNCQYIDHRPGYDYSQFLKDADDNCKSYCKTAAVKIPDSSNSKKQFDETCSKTCSKVNADSQLFRQGFLAGVSSCPVQTRQQNGAEGRR
jgi:hypothetical protein